jgi:hypothetical protein
MFATCGKTVRKLNFALLKTSQGAKVYTVNRTKMEDIVDKQIKCALKGFIVFNVIYSTFFAVNK